VVSHRGGAPRTGAPRSPSPGVPEPDADGRHRGGVSVSTLLKRLDEIPETPEGEAAKALLRARAFTPAVEAQAKDLLTQIGTIGRTVEDVVGPTEEEEAVLEKRLWSWYIVWSTIARSSIKDRRILRALGFLNSKGTPVSDDDPVPSPVSDDDDDLEIVDPTPFIIDPKT